MQALETSRCGSSEFRYNKKPIISEHYNPEPRKETKAQQILRKNIVFEYDKPGEGLYKNSVPKGVSTSL